MKSTNSSNKYFAMIRCAQVSGEKKMRCACVCWTMSRLSLSDKFALVVDLEYSSPWLSVFSIRQRRQVKEKERICCLWVGPCSASPRTVSFSLYSAVSSLPSSSFSFSLCTTHPLTHPLSLFLSL